MTSVQFANSITSATDSEVMALVSRMAEINGAAHINHAVLPLALLEAARSLIVALGASSEQARQLTDRELQDIYGVTRRGGALSGRSIVQKRFKMRPSAPVAVPATATQAIAQAAPLPDSVLQDIKSLRADVNTLAGDSTRADCAIASLEARLASLDAVKPIAITVADLPTVTFEVSHPNLPRLIRKCANKKDVWLVGDRGSGKSIAARQVAKALGVECYIMTGADDKTDIVGYTQPHDGSVKVTPFRLAWINGGVILLDEMDTYNPAALIVINDALANNKCTFDDGAYDKHPNCYVIAATNTDGRGPNAMYSARSVIDASTRDRFAYIPWPYVAEMETMLGSLNPAWTSYIQAVRKAMEEMAIPETPSPRATIEGGQSIAQGDSWDEAAESYIFKGMSADYIRRVNNAVKMADYQVKCPVSVI